MPNLEHTLELAKRGKFTRAELYAGMMALAEQLREPGMSEAQAFSKLIASPEGAALYAVQKSLPGAVTSNPAGKLLLPRGNRRPVTCIRRQAIGMGWSMD